MFGDHLTTRGFDNEFNFELKSFWDKPTITSHRVFQEKSTEICVTIEQDPFNTTESIFKLISNLRPRSPILIERVSKFPTSRHYVKILTDVDGQVQFRVWN